MSLHKYNQNDKEDFTVKHYEYQLLSYNDHLEMYKILKPKNWLTIAHCTQHRYIHYVQGTKTFTHWGFGSQLSKANS